MRAVRFAGLIRAWGFRVADSAEAALLDRVPLLPVDLALIDPSDAREAGWGALTRLRQRSRMPVIVLLQHDSTLERVLALERGADAVLPKDGEPRELQARIKALLRPREGDAAEVLMFGRFKLEPMTRRLSGPGASAWCCHRANTSFAARLPGTSAQRAATPGAAAPSARRRRHGAGALGGPDGVEAATETERRSGSSPLIRTGARHRAICSIRRCADATDAAVGPHPPPSPESWRWEFDLPYFGATEAQRSSNQLSGRWTTVTLARVAHGIIWRCSGSGAYLRAETRATRP